MNFDKLPKTEFFQRIVGVELDRLDRRKNAEQKISGLVNLLKLTKQEINDRYKIRDCIYHHLQQFYPECELLIFGSTVNGFGFKGCDLDLLFLPFPEYCNVDFKDKKDVVVPNPYRILKGTRSRDELLDMDETSHLTFVKKALHMKQMFQQITFIPAKCPILFLKIFGYDFDCDLSVSNRLVLRNTELLKLFCEMDSRVQPLMMMLRYWAKSLGFISKSALSSYALSILVIFALQNTDPPILPSVKSLIETAGYSCIIDGWETAFNERIGTLPQFNLDSIEQLLEHFLSFYWNYDFVNNIVSPYHGKSLLIKDLKESTNEKIRSFPVNAFSIQDPFILKNNISRNAAIVTSFKIALSIAKDLISHDCNFSIQQFLNNNYYDKNFNSIYEPTMSSFPVPEDCIKSTIVLTHEVMSKLGITSDLKPWFEKVTSTVLDVLNYGLIIECEVIDKIIWDDEESKDLKNTKVSILDSLKNLELLVSIQCAVYTNTWTSRKNKASEVDINNIDTDFPDILKKEYAISVAFLPKPYLTNESPMLWFLCNCYKYPVNRLTDVIIVFSPFTSSSEFKALGTFLRSFVKKTVEKLLNDT